MMVDDILTLQKCNNESLKLNAVTNAFIEGKKLMFAEKKCVKIHMGKKHNKYNCPEMRVHGDEMLEGKKEKYLGDYIVTGEGSKSTLIDREMKVNAIVTEIISILKEVPLGKYKLEIGF